MDKSIASINNDLQKFFLNSKIKVEHSLIYEKYNTYDFYFSKEIAYFLEKITGLSASAMLHQHSLSQFDNFIKNINSKITSTISIFDKIISVEISMELTLIFTHYDNWFVESYGEKKTFEEIYSHTIDLITFHRTIKTFRDLKNIRSLDKYKVFNERINDLNMNMYTDAQCLSELCINTRNPLNYSDINKIIAKIFSIEEQHIFKQIFSLINFSSNIIEKKLVGTYFRFCFEKDELNLVLANNKHFAHYIYSLTFHDFNSKCTHQDYPYLNISVVDESEKFILHYKSRNDVYIILQFDNLNSLYDKILQIYRTPILDDLSVNLNEFKQKHFELYKMTVI